MTASCLMPQRLYGKFPSLRIWDTARLRFTAAFLADRIYPGLLRAEADDENTLHLYFEKPVPMLIYRMAGWGSAMFSPGVLIPPQGMDGYGKRDGHLYDQGAGARRLRCD